MINDNSLRVTIGIPTYNRADSYLKNALQSVLAQQYENLEIIVSDNCSKDHTKDLIYAMDDGRIRYFRQQRNISANDNFNFCLKQASGDYFLLLHDDDLIDPDFVATCMQAASGNRNIGVICTGIRTIDGKGNLLSENVNKLKEVSADDFFLGWFNSKIALYLCSTLYNTEALKALGGFYSPKNLFQDVVASVQLSVNNGQLNIHAIKASFRRHQDNRGTGARALDWTIDSRYLLDLMCRLSTEKKSEILGNGRRFFSKKCYHQASTIVNPLVRWITYYKIYRKFDRGYPLYDAFRKYEIRGLKRLIKRNLFF
jgi:glycosyltransferase involved in cell wall biosynthesis